MNPRTVPASLAFFALLTGCVGESHVYDARSETFFTMEEGQDVARVAVTLEYDPSAFPEAPWLGDVIRLTAVSSQDAEQPEESESSLWASFIESDWGQEHFVGPQNSPQLRGVYRDCEEASCTLEAVVEVGRIDTPGARIDVSADTFLSVDGRAQQLGNATLTLTPID